MVLFLTGISTIEVIFMLIVLLAMIILPIWLVVEIIRWIRRH